jgi:cob(I)alamin adenosyltransferase
MHVSIIPVCIPQEEKYTKNMIAVFTGNGKGKTTSCIGHMVRAQGAGMRAIMFQFIKGPWKSGEHNFENLNIYRGGKGFVGILGDTLPFKEHKAFAQQTFKTAQKAILSKKWDLVVLDEINVAMQIKLLKLADVVNLLKKVPKDTIVLLSGRDAHKKIIDMADLVTEMKEIKHPFNKGILAKKGFDF